ncbi:hypothetical protein PMAYCL1PPCAC_33393, partial [Pristionchus mayeri]
TLETKVFLLIQLGRSLVAGERIVAPLPTRNIAIVHGCAEWTEYHPSIRDRSREAFFSELRNERDDEKALERIQNDTNTSMEVECDPSWEVAPSLPSLDATAAAAELTTVLSIYAVAAAKLPPVSAPIHGTHK